MFILPFAGLRARDGRENLYVTVETVEYEVMQQEGDHNVECIKGRAGF